MRLWLKDTERRPDPEPLKTDDRTPLLVGMGLWTLGLIAAVVFFGRTDDTGNSWWFGACVIGLAMGIGGLVYTRYRTR